MAFIHENFLLGTESARRLYHDWAASEPILDYHNHLPPADLARNRSFNNLFEAWLEGDHYKWRAMRTNGVAETFCTGSAEPYEKFLAWARTVPHTLRNPLYHWTHLELKRYFEVDELLSERTAPAVWEKANALLKTPAYATRGLVEKFKVRALCTTDDPADSMEYHQTLAQEWGACRVYPTFRPDKALLVHQPEAFNAWVDKLGQQANVEIGSLQALMEALDQRHQEFHALGARLSDHGLSQAYASFGTEAEAKQIFARARAGTAATAQEHAQFATFLMVYFGQLDAKRGWTKQLHLGAQRNNNGRALATLGPDTGFDSIGDWPQAAALSQYLDAMDKSGALPRTIIYNLNPADNYLFATMIGNFQDGSIAGKIQFGSGWWFLDQKEAMEWQINALSNNGLLSRFVGMLTDSRSFLSFPRHEYFRRVLCNLLGTDMEKGEIPADFDMVGTMVQNICYKNAREYLGVQVGT